MRIFVSGASGNVGKTLVRTIMKLDWPELVGGWCKETGEDLGELAGIGTIGIKATDDLKAGIEASNPDIVIDFSATPVLPGNLRLYAEKSLNAVIGTTGLTDEDLAPFVKEVKEKGLRWAVIPNYGLGITLVMDFIKKVRGYYPYISIIDRHFPGWRTHPAALRQASQRHLRGARLRSQAKRSIPESSERRSPISRYFRSVCRGPVHTRNMRCFSGGRMRS
jgi:4-hydroxy-tetrahydrodipicolinate reductase